MNINYYYKISKRKEKMYEFYYKGLGDKIRRRRIELNMTQETLAKGICSNTYISKLENNKVALNREHLCLIMERMGLSSEHIGFPEMMVESLENAVKFFFYKDIQAYKDLFLSIQKYDHGILFYVIRLGYYVLVEDMASATIIFDEMYRYLNSLEEFGFAVFLIFSSFYHFYMHNYQSARMQLEKMEGNLLNDDMLYGLYGYARFLAYGHLDRMSYAFAGYTLASSVFQSKSNIRRLSELQVYHNMYRLIDRAKPETMFDKIQLDYLSENEKNRYLFYLALQSDTPDVYTNLMKQKDHYYLASRFFQAIKASSKEDKNEYEDLKKELNQLHYETKTTIDYYKLIRLIETKDDIALKEYLINFVLPFVKQRQNICLMRQVVKEIARILQEKKRYKDALTYLQKIENYIDELKYIRKIDY